MLQDNIIAQSGLGLSQYTSLKSELDDSVARFKQKQKIVVESLNRINNLIEKEKKGK